MLKPDRRSVQPGKVASFGIPGDFVIRAGSRLVAISRVCDKIKADAIAQSGRQGPYYPMPLRITANFAISADGKVSTRGHQASGFGSSNDHARLLELRAEADAILVGRSTLEADTMALGLGGRDDLAKRRNQAGKSDFPARVVACGHQWPDPGHPLFHSPGGPIFLLAGPDSGPPPVYPPATILHPQHSPLVEVLDNLAQQEGWQHLHCEGGPRLFRSLLEAGRVDSLFLTLTPRIFGGFSAPSLLPQSTRWASSRSWTLTDMQSTGDEIFLCYQSNPLPSPLPR